MKQKCIDELKKIQATAPATLDEFFIENKKIQGITLRNSKSDGSYYLNEPNYFGGNIVPDFNAGWLFADEIVKFSALP